MKRGTQASCYRWRPNLSDEGDNHVLELAVVAGDAPIVTFNRRDFRSGELRFPGIIFQTPGAWAEVASILEGVEPCRHYRNLFGKVPPELSWCH
jgi:hypothetical protein